MTKAKHEQRAVAVVVGKESSLPVIMTRAGRPNIVADAKISLIERGLVIWDENSAQFIFKPITEKSRRLFFRNEIPRVNFKDIKKFFPPEDYGSDSDIVLQNNPEFIVRGKRLKTTSRKEYVDVGGWFSKEVYKRSVSKRKRNI